MRGSVYAVSLILVLCFAGCEQLQPKEEPVSTEPDLLLPPGGPPIAPAAVLPPTPEQIIAGFSSKNSMEITDHDLAQVAALESAQQSITELNLKSATLSSAAFQSMARFPSLVNVDMESTALTDTHWELLSEVKSIEQLNLTRSGINNSYMEHIGELSNLTHLTL